jgi:meiotically up-regulated gene 157 (Mug157) protein
MIWSGYRPSDDPCEYGYFIPGNMFAVVILKFLEEIFSVIVPDDVLLEKAEKLRLEISDGISRYGVVKHPEYGQMYAYETDGLGNVNLMDDANVPSLLAIPYIGYTNMNDEIYGNTRRYVLSKGNRYYFEGKYLKGIGSPHTPHNHVWPISLEIQALTSDNEAEIKDILEQLRCKELGEELLISKSMLKSGERVFLDDFTVDMLEEGLKVKVTVVDNDGADFISSVLGQSGPDLFEHI